MEKDQIAPVLLSPVSKSCSENNRIPVGSQSSSEQAAIGIDRKALAPPPRIARQITPEWNDDYWRQLVETKLCE